MDTNVTKQNHFVRAAVVFVACVFLIWLFAFVGFFLGVGFLFFAPQFLFPYDGFVTNYRDNAHLVFSNHTGVFLNFAQLFLSAAGFTWFARRMSIGGMILTAFVTIVVVGIVTNIGFGLFGIEVQFDGP